MARAAKNSKAVATRQSSQSIALIDNELANEVASLKEQIGQPGGNQLKVKPTGQVVTPDGIDLGLTVQLVVLDFLSKNFYYGGVPFDATNPSPPVCYAMGKKIEDMRPEDDSPEKQGDEKDGRCKGCWANQFASAPNKKGKACQNRRELVVRVIDPDNADADVSQAPLYILSLPPTALKSYDAMVANVSRSLNGPPVKAILTMECKNVGTYASISFIDAIPNPDYAIDYGRRAEMENVLHRHPDFAAYAAKPQPAARGRGAQKPAGRR